MSTFPLVETARAACAPSSTCPQYASHRFLARRSWNYLIWGLYFFVLLMLEKFFLLKVLNKAPAVVGHIYTLFFVVVSWAIFAIEDFAQLGAYLKVMFGLGGVPLVDAQLGYYVTSYLHSAGGRCGLHSLGRQAVP